MSDGEEDIFATAAVSHEASSLVSKWLDDSDAESSEETESPVAHAGGRNALSRLDGIGLGAEDLHDLVAQRRLDPTERKMKYRMEASEKLKETREKEALEMIKKLEDDVFDNDSKIVQASKKRVRTVTKSTILEGQAASKKKAKLASNAQEPIAQAEVTHVLHQTEEVVFDFTKPVEVPKPAVEAKEVKPKESTEKKPSKPQNSPAKKHNGSNKDKRDHKKPHKK